MRTLNVENLVTALDNACRKVTKNVVHCKIDKYCICVSDNEHSWYIPVYEIDLSQFLLMVAYEVFYTTENVAVLASELMKAGIEVPRRMMRDRKIILYRDRYLKQYNDIMFLIDDMYDDMYKTEYDPSMEAMLDELLEDKRNLEKALLKLGINIREL